MPITTFRSQFDSASKWVISQAKKALPIVCGVPESTLSQISPRYMVDIFSEKAGGVLGFGKEADFQVHAYLQDNIVMDVSSDWYGILQSLGGDAALGLADNFVQGGAGLSIRTSATTRRKWNGSSPISITLKLKFEAVNDVYREVLLPCSGLQGLALPSAHETLPLVRPPGPNPYNIPQLAKAIAAGRGNTEASGVRGENISVNIGEFLGFTSIIVKDVKITYENRMSVNGPIGAEVEFTFETYEMLTRQGLAKVYTDNLTINNSKARSVGTAREAA